MAQQLPDEMIKQNARLSLLHGEACGIRGEWQRALEALGRAREYFSRKGDRRLDALACLKLSTVYSNYGDTERAAQAAEAGVAIVPPDAVGTRLRLEGNVAVTRLWHSGPLQAVVSECERIAKRASDLGMEHFAAIGHHNAGEMQLRMGLVPPALANLEKAALYWSETPTNPFAFNEDLTTALLLDGQTDRARAFAMDAIRRTSPWPRPRAHALHAWARVLASEGRFHQAITFLQEATADPTVLGGGNSLFLSALIEFLI